MKKTKTKKFKIDTADGPAFSEEEWDLYVHTCPEQKNVTTKIIGLEGTKLEKYFNKPHDIPATIIIEVAGVRLWLTPKQAKKVGEYLTKESESVS